MTAFTYIVACLLVFHQFHLIQSRVADRMRIVGGDFAVPGEIKYIVVTYHDDRYYNCGGGIIDNYYVLSAAHCFINSQNQFSNKKIKVVAGVNDYNDVKDPRRVEVDVEKIYIPKYYQPALFAYDIALIKLKQSLNITENDLQKLSLSLKPHNLANRMASMAGFGFDQHKKFYNYRTHQTDEVGKSSGLLRKADILMFSNLECQKFYPRNKIHDSNLCGKMVKESQRREYGVCNGDSGSPLVLDSKEVVGIVSWSFGCDEREVPLVYTRVSSYLDFMEDAKNEETAYMRVKVFE